MEMQNTNVGWFDNEELLKLPYTEDNTFDTLLFNESWDWLMPVVKKCFSTGDDTTQWDGLFDALSTVDIDKVYNAVGEFIKWYNKTK